MTTKYILLGNLLLYIKIITNSIKKVPTKSRFDSTKFSELTWKKFAQYKWHIVIIKVYVLVYWTLETSNDQLTITN